MPSQTDFTLKERDLLIRLDEKVTSMSAKLDRYTDDHESRIRSLERWRWISVGLGIAGGTTVSTVVNRLLDFV